MQGAGVGRSIPDLLAIIPGSIDQLPAATPSATPDAPKTWDTSPATSTPPVNRNGRKRATPGTTAEQYGRRDEKGVDPPVASNTARLEPVFVEKRRCSPEKYLTA